METTTKQGLSIARHFTQEGIHPFEAVQWRWENRDAVIVGKDGTPVFEARGVEFPSFWSQRATDIVASKYFRVVRGERETSVKYMLTRVAREITDWGWEDNYFAGREARETFYAELLYILLHQYAAFNSPVWFNVGCTDRPAVSACFILDVDDSMASILEWYRQEAMIFKGGGGAGVNISKIRAKGSRLSNGGTASGPVSFMRGADANAGTIKSGGSTRRAAKMVIMDAEHRDILDFIWCKAQAESVARTLESAGFGADLDGAIAQTLPFQNANNSVSVGDGFMVDAQARVGLADAEGYRRQEILGVLAHAAWTCGDPGLFFRDTINKWHTTPHRGAIVSSNPCSEVLQPPNTACNLASLNLLKFLDDDGTFDTASFTHTVDIMVTAMDILVDRAAYPTEAITSNSRDYRPLGLGYANLGALLMARGLPYDSDEGRQYAAAITALMTGEAYAQSARLAEVQGAFAGYGANTAAMTVIIEQHVAYVCEPAVLQDESATDVAPVWGSAYAAWSNARSLGDNNGYRNCQVTLLAPTGTISFMMDCDTTGIEPCLGLVTTKKLVGGGEMTMVNRAVERALGALGYSFKTSMARPDHFENDIRSAIRTEHGPVFQTALGDNPLSWKAHVDMVAAVQPFLSGGVSKTINMPHDATVEDVRQAFIYAWEQGLKSIAIYRDGCKVVQPVTVNNGTHESNSAAKTPSLSPTAGATCPGMPLPLSAGRRRLPDERQSLTHKFAVGGHEGYLTVGLYEDGTPGELFVRVSKEGSTINGLIDACATMISIALQYGVPLGAITTKLRHTRFEPMGFTGNPDIQNASSIADYIAQWLEKKFGAPLTPYGESLKAQAVTYAEYDATPLCSECGSRTIRQGTCCVCPSCGLSTGC